SYAVASTTCEPNPRVAAVVNVYGAAVALPTTVPSIEKSTRRTPWSSLASAEITKPGWTFAPSVGAVIITVGGDVSVGAMPTAAHAMLIAVLVGPGYSSVAAISVAVRACANVSFAVK